MGHQTTTISESKAHILCRARELFAMHGYRGVSIREMAEACGLAKASLYYHFRDKRDLYFQVLEMDAGDLVAALEQASYAGSTARERIYSLARAYVYALTSGHNLIPLAFRESVTPGQDIHDFMQRWRDPVLQPIRRVVASGIARGELREVDPDLATHSLFAMLNAFIAYGLFRKQGSGLDPDAVDGFVVLYLEGMVPRQSEA